MEGLVASLGLIELSKVDFLYPDGAQALKGIDFSVKPRERVAVLGPNGAGKSTLFQLFNGLLQPTRGTVSVKGRVVEKSYLKEVRRTIGMVFQDPDDQLFSGTVRQEIAYGLLNLGLAGRRMDEVVCWALEVVGLSGFENKSPFNLSGGEKKRVALASVLAMKPEVLVLDEPTGALDPIGAAKIIALLDRVNRELGITIVFATHDVDSVPLMADTVFVMDKGEIILSGPTGEVFSQKDVLRAHNLRLPRVAHLAELLERDGDYRFPSSPLTIGQAKKMFLDHKTKEKGQK
ncbi:MAG: ATP-binding cassette domain-containing protein [Syntrophobacteraceae bacterium]|nr:ATP-binding cassette domain-containing protein [Syntrophobacteraceae bacterium]